jgi:hypothetical protein
MLVEVYSNMVACTETTCFREYGYRSGHISQRVISKRVAILPDIPEVTYILKLSMNLLLILKITQQLLLKSCGIYILQKKYVILANIHPMAIFYTPVGNMDTLGKHF